MLLHFKTFVMIDKLKERLAGIFSKPELKPVPVRVRVRVH